MSIIANRQIEAPLGRPLNDLSAKDIKFVTSEAAHPLIATYGAIGLIRRHAKALFLVVMMMSATLALSPATAQQIYSNIDPQIVPRFPVTGPASASVFVPVDEQRRLGLVTIQTTNSSPSNSSSCSGTLLNRYWVLTAHHCIGLKTLKGDLLVTPVMPANIRISAAWTATTVNPTRIEHLTTNARIASYTASSGLDIALLYLGGGDFGPVETDWYSKLWDGTWGQRIPGSYNLDLYGRGISAWAFIDTAGNPQKATNDSLYRVQRSMTAAGPSERWFVTSSVIGGGDSGGPTFVNIDTSAGTKRYLAGVHSFCVKANYVSKPLPAGWTSWEGTTYALCGDQSILPVTDAIRNFIQEQPGDNTPTNIYFPRSTDKSPFTLYFLVSGRFQSAQLQIDRRVQPGEIHVDVQQETYSWEGWDGPASFPLGIPRTGLNTIGVGWDTIIDVAAIGGSRFVTRSLSGELSWRQLVSASPDGWLGPKTVGRNFRAFKRIFGAEEGVLYAIRSNGELYWYKYPQFRTGEGGEACPSLRWQDCPLTIAPWRGPFGIDAPVTVYSWKGPKLIGSGWGSFKHVFYAGSGVIYAVRQNGDLLWYRHQGQSDGAARWRNGIGRVVGEGWNQFSRIVSVGNGGIIALRPNGELVWYRHKTWNSDLPDERNYREWEGPILVRTGLMNVADMFVETEEQVYRGPN